MGLNLYWRDTRLTKGSEFFLTLTKTNWEENQYHFCVPSYVALEAYHSTPGQSLTDREGLQQIRETVLHHLVYYVSTIVVDRWKDERSEKKGNAFSHWKWDRTLIDWPLFGAIGSIDRSWVFFLLFFRVKRDDFTTLIQREMRTVEREGRERGREGGRWGQTKIQTRQLTFT